MSRIAEVLAALREERQQLLTEVSRIDRAIEALEDASSAGSPAQRTPGRFSMLSLYQAVADYLATTEVPQTSRQIAEGLRAGGYPTTSARFTGTVRTMLRRKRSSLPYGIREHSDGKRWYLKR